MKKSLLFLFFAVMGLFGLSSCSNPVIDGISANRYILYDCEAFRDERAWVEFCDRYDDYTKYYYGFIDTEGNILYSTLETVGMEVYNLGNGSGIVYDGFKTVLIDKNGDVKLTLEGNVEVKAYGGGYACIYQDKSTINYKEHFYGIVNSDGEWIVPFESCSQEGLYDDIKYLGDEFFGDSGVEDLTYSIWKADQSIVMTLSGILSCKDIVFSNGIAFLNNSNYKNRADVSVTVKTYDEYGEEQITINDIDNNSCSILYSDGMVESVGNFISYYDFDKAFYDGKVVTTKKIHLENGSFAEITDYTKETPETVEFKAYPENMIEDMTFNGDYGLVQIRGLDDKVYTVLIDSRGNKLIEPIQNRYVDEFILTPDGHLYYRSDNYYHVIDKNGNSKRTGINENLYFVGDIGVVRNLMFGLYYVKSNGDKLFEKLKMK